MVIMWYNIETMEDTVYSTALEVIKGIDLN